MKFLFLKLRAFGHFTNYELTFDESKGFHIIYGKNEAGKSTTLRSFTNFLYGIPARTSDSFLHDNKNLEIEGSLKNDAGDIIHFVRRKGNKNTVVDVNGKPLNGNIVDDFLNGITEEHFLNMFGLDHVRLRQGGESLLQSGGSLGESLFSAASGISILRNVFTELEGKAENLYTKRATTREIPKLLKKEKQLNREIADLQLKIQEWKELERNYNSGNEEIKELFVEIKTLRSEHQKLQRIIRTSSKVAQLRKSYEDLRILGDMPVLSPTMKDIRIETQQRLSEATKEKNKAEQEVKELGEKLDLITIPEGLVDQSTVIDGLYREVQNYQDNEAKLPILQGTKKQQEDRILSIMKEITSGEAAIDKIDFFRISSEKRETIRELCGTKPLLEQEFESNEREIKELESDLGEKGAELIAVKQYPNIEELEKVLRDVQKEGDLESQVANYQKEQKSTKKEIEEAIKALPLWQGTINDLMELPIPSLIETIKRFEDTHKDLVSKQQNIIDKIEDEEKQILHHQESIDQLESLTDIPSEEDLVNVRSRREKGWKHIRSKLYNESIPVQDDSYTNGQMLEEVYENDVQKADSIADLMRNESEKVGQKKKHLSDIDRCREKIQKYNQDLNDIGKRLEDWEKDWIELWHTSNILPLTPTEMKEWMEKYQGIKTNVQQFNRKEEDLKGLQGKIEHHKSKVLSVLSKYEQVSDFDSLNSLVAFGDNYAKEVHSESNKRDNLIKSIKELENKQKRLIGKQTEVNKKIERWKDDWRMAIKDTAISEAAIPTVAKKLIDKYEECINAHDELTKIIKEIESLQLQVSVYEEKVDLVCREVSLDLPDSKYEVKVNTLNKSLTKAMQDERTLIEINEQLQKYKKTLKDAKEEITSCKDVFTELFKQACCESMEQLIEVEDKIIQKGMLEEKIKTLEDELLGIGDGLSLEGILEEVEGIELDSVDVELEEVERRLQDIEPVRSEKEQEFGVLKKKYEEVIKGNSLATLDAEQEKQSILAKLNDLTSQYVQLKLASVLLRKGIEHYREQNQDPILTRAGQIFKRLTLESFINVVVDYDEKDQPVLMGLRENNERVPIAGMSDGTKDQLYLSLRIATIEAYTTKNEPIPFIVDDILVHFDDSRSKETLKVLLELSQKTQVIFLSHHYRLVEIMNEISSGDKFQKIELKEEHVVAN